MTLRLVAIRPATLPFAENVAQLLDEELGRRGLAGALVKGLANYPAARPWRSRTPTSGPRKGGRRTGTLGRNWRLARIERSPVRRAIEVTNLTDYAVHVQGPARGRKNRRQTQEMRTRGWPNITSVSRAEWRRTRPIIVRIIAGRDTRLRRRAFPR